MRRSAHFIIAAAFLCGSAAAQEVSLGSPDSSGVFVWKDRASQKSALVFLSDNGVTQVTYDAIKPLISCIVKRNTPAVIVERVSASYRIEVTSGPHAGCKGVVAQEYVNG